MNSSKYRFTLDMHMAQSQVSLPVMLNDTARKLYISFSDGGKQYHIADGCLAIVRINRPTGTFIERFCPIEDNTNVVYDFAQQVNTAIASGIHECEVTLYGLNDEVLTSAKYTMVVSERVVNAGDIEISDGNWTMLDGIASEEARRQASETARENAEDSRIEAERKRVAAEIKREENTALAIDAANDAAEAVLERAASGEFNGKDGRDGTDGRDGYTPQKGVDYFDGKDGAVGPAGPSGVYVGTEAPTDGQTAWIDTDEEPDEGEGGGAQIDVTAAVGQVIAVKAVDENSKPTEYKAVDLPKVVQPDFAANEGEDGHILNRTHYVDKNGVVHKLPNKYIDAEWMATSEEVGGGIIFNADSIKFTSSTYLLALNKQSFNVNVGVEYDVYWNGTKYVCIPFEVSGELFFGNGNLMSLAAIKESPFSNPDAPFIFSGYGDTLNMITKNSSAAETVSLRVTTHAVKVYNKLPKEFLPDDVGGSANIDVTAEVGQTIIVEEVDANGKPTKWKSADYQPRTHWQGEKVMIPEETFEAGIDGRNISMHGDTKLMGLTVGKTYIVVFDGVTYTCVAEAGVASLDGVTMYNVISIGNLGMSGGVDNGRPFFLSDIIDYDPPSWTCIPYEYGEHTLSVTGVDETNTIPEKYVSYAPAFPYYIEVTGSGTDDDPYSCAETFADIVALYKSGREIKAKRRMSINNNGDYQTRIFDLTDTFDNVGTLGLFWFIAPGLGDFSNDILLFSINEDGSCNITDNLD